MRKREGVAKQIDMNKKNFEMELLNKEEYSKVMGGAAPTTCNKAGDTIACNIIGNIKACVGYEVGCEPHFSSSCTSKKFTISGCNSVTFS